jgi:hypothetical protein
LFIAISRVVPEATAPQGNRDGLPLTGVGLCREIYNRARLGRQGRRSKKN